MNTEKPAGIAAGGLFFVPHLERLGSAAAYSAAPVRTVA